MDNKLLEERSEINVMIKKFNLENLFVPTFLLFSALCIFVVGYLINSESLVNVYDMYSYFFVAAGFGLFLKVFVSTYANALYAIVKKKWFLLGLNLLSFALQIYLGAYAAYTLTDQTYILQPLQFLLFASGIFYFQNLVDNNFKILDLSLVGLGVYASLYLITWLRLFDSDIRFWNVAGLLGLLVELLLFFVATHKFMKVVTKED